MKKLDFLFPVSFPQETYSTRVIASIDVSAADIYHQIKMFILKHLDVFEDTRVVDIAVDGKWIFSLDKGDEGWTLYGYDPELRTWLTVCEY
jgi:hypothetical protein